MMFYFTKSMCYLKKSSKTDIDNLMQIESVLVVVSLLNNHKGLISMDNVYGKDIL